MNDIFSLNLKYNTKTTSKQQRELYKKYKNCTNQAIKYELKVELCIGFYSLINYLLKKRNSLNYDNSIIILVKLINKLDMYNDKKSSLYTYFYHVIINQITDINRKILKNRVDYVNSAILNNYYKSNDNKLDIEDIKSILPKDEYEVILDKYYGVKCKKMSKRYYNLCLKTSLLRIKNHYL
jgi:hypothetical protein